MFRLLNMKETQNNADCHDIFSGVTKLVNGVILSKWSHH